MRRIIWIVAILFLIMSTGVLAEQTDPCNHKCPDQKVGFIKYCDKSDPTAPECECDYFDYESGYGYCPGTYNHPKGVVLKLCDCERVTDIISGNEYSIKVTILNDGVYWADDNDSIEFSEEATPVSYSAISVTSYLDENHLCEGEDGISNIGAVCRYLDEDGNLIDGTTNTCADGGDPGYTFSVGSNCKLHGVGAKIFSTKPARLFETNRPFVVIDLPSMYYDNTIVKKGDKLKVKIEITQSKDVCPDCDVFCACDEVVLGTFGCYEPRCTLTFPYFVSDVGNWWNGVAITNKASYSGTAVFHFYDQFGNTATKTYDVKPYGIIVKTADEILNSALGGSRINKSEAYQMIVVTDFPASGLCIIGDSETGIYGYTAENTCCTCVNH